MRDEMPIAGVESRVEPITHSSPLIPFPLLFFRLFYAGACEGQMPEILTMIQIQRLTPTPAVLTIVSDI